MAAPIAAQRSSIGIITLPPPPSVSLNRTLILAQPYPLNVVTVGSVMRQGVVGVTPVSIPRVLGQQRSVYANYQPNLSGQKCGPQV